MVVSIALLYFYIFCTCNGIPHPVMSVGVLLVGESMLIGVQNVESLQSKSVHNLWRLWSWFIINLWQKCNMKSSQGSLVKVRQIRAQLSIKQCKGEDWMIIIRLCANGLSKSVVKMYPFLVSLSWKRPEKFINS